MEPSHPTNPDYFPLDCYIKEINLFYLSQCGGSLYSPMHGLYRRGLIHKDIGKHLGRWPLTQSSGSRKLGPQGESTLWEAASEGVIMSLSQLTTLSHIHLFVG